MKTLDPLATVRRNDPADDSTAEFGTVIFECRFRRLFALMIALVGGVFATIMTDALFINAVLPARRGMGYAALFGVILVVAVLIVLMGVLLLRRPPVFFQVTDQGIVNFLGPLGRLEEPCFIPWSRVESLELVRLAVRDAGSRRGWSYFIALHVAADEDWPPADFPAYDAKKQVVYLDALSGTPSRRVLLDAMNRVYSQQ